jgi:hypothetical protein
LALAPVFTRPPTSQRYTYPLTAPDQRPVLQLMTVRERVTRGGARFLGDGDGDGDGEGAGGGGGETACGPILSVNDATASVLSASS